VPLQLRDGPGAVALGDALQDALVLFDGGRCGARHLEIGAPDGARHEVKRLGDARQDRVLGGGDEGKMEDLVIVGQVSAASLTYTTPLNRDAHGVEVVGGAPPGRQANGLHLVDDAGFAKWRELTIAYNIPDRFVRMANVSRASISLSGRNLHTWTNYGGFEPEATFLGGSRGGNIPFEQAILPQLTSWIVTLNLGM